MCQRALHHARAGVTAKIEPLDYVEAARRPAAARTRGSRRSRTGSSATSATPCSGDTPEAREDAILKGGLKIYATLDPAAQANAQGAVDDTLATRSRGSPPSLVAMEPTTGAVKAMVAGPGFESSQYNIATSPSGRQPGSTWKVITLATAMQNHYSANDTVNGSSPCDFGRARVDGQRRGR